MSQFIRRCSVCDNFVNSTRKAHWPLCEDHKNVKRPKCWKCKKPMERCEYMMMGPDMKCFTCDTTWNRVMGYAHKRGKSYT